MSQNISFDTFVAVDLIGKLTGNSAEFQKVLLALVNLMTSENLETADHSYISTSIALLSDPQLFSKLNLNLID